MSYFKNIKKNQFKKDYYNFFIILILTLILFKQIDFFKKVYFTLTRSYDTRLVSSYEFCGKESIGFLNYIKAKFNINFIVPIINFESSPNSSWYFSDLNKTSTNKIIFLNYDKYNQDISISHDLEAYRIIYEYNKCYFLEKR
jgi:hypothetical protein